MASKSSFHRSQADIFATVNAILLPRFPELCATWLPSGRVERGEYVAFNPNRIDNRLGSFRINLRTGRWADFSKGPSGGDPISLYAFIRGLRQIDAARELAKQFGVLA